VSEVCVWCRRAPGRGIGAGHVRRGGRGRGGEEEGEGEEEEGGRRGAGTGDVRMEHLFTSSGPAWSIPHAHAHAGAPAAAPSSLGPPNPTLASPPRPTRPLSPWAPTWPSAWAASPRASGVPAPSPTRARSGPCLRPASCGSSGLRCVGQEELRTSQGEGLFRAQGLLLLHVGAVALFGNDWHFSSGCFLPLSGDLCLVTCDRQEYRTRLSLMKEDILRRRRAGKLPASSTALLKSWWNSHQQHPYPTVRHSPALSSGIPLSWAACAPTLQASKAQCLYVSGWRNRTSNAQWVMRSWLSWF